MDEDNSEHLMRQRETTSSFSIRWAHRSHSLKCPWYDELHSLCPPIWSGVLWEHYEYKIKETCPCATIACLQYIYFLNRWWGIQLVCRSRVLQCGRFPYKLPMAACPQTPVQKEEQTKGKQIERIWTETEWPRQSCTDRQTQREAYF